MMCALDSTTAIAHIRGKNPHVQRHMAAVAVSQIGIPAMVLGELLSGAKLSKEPAGERAKVDTFAAPFAILPFDAADAEAYADIRADLIVRGLVIGHADLIIAAIARTRDLTVVTHNKAHFARVPGLKIVDWEIP